MAPWPARRPRPGALRRGVRRGGTPGSRSAASSVVDPLAGELRIARGRRRGAVLMDGLALVVVLRMELAIRAGDELGGLVGLEALVERLLLAGRLRVAEPLPAEHQVVVGLQVLRIYAEHLPEGRDRFLVLPLQEQRPADLVQHH